MGFFTNKLMSSSAKSTAKAVGFSWKTIKVAAEHGNMNTSSNDIAKAVILGRGGMYQDDLIMDINTLYSHKEITALDLVWLMISTKKHNRKTLNEKVVKDIDNKITEQLNLFF